MLATYLPTHKKLVSGILGSLMLLSGPAVFANSLNVVKVYKSPTCGCCSKWVTHMENNGFHVRAFNRSDVSQIKKEQGVPQQFWSCHTAQIGKYTIEGHVPAADIKKLLAENRPVAGLAVPGMPIGSPGMPGLFKHKYQVYEYTDNGQTKAVAQY